MKLSDVDDTYEHCNSGCVLNDSQIGSTRWSAAGTSEVQPGRPSCFPVPSTPMLSCLENGNRYEGSWERGMKNGHGRFFHLDHGQLFEGFWVDNVAKCGTMIDFGRDEAPEPTQFPIPKVGSQSSWGPETRETAISICSPTCQGATDEVLFSSIFSKAAWGPSMLFIPTNPSPPPNPTPAALQVELLDPDGVLKEAMDKLMKPEEDED